MSKSKGIFGRRQTSPRARLALEPLESRVLFSSTIPGVQWDWMRELPGSSGAKGVALDGSGSIVMTGNDSYGALPECTNRHSGDQDAWVAKYAQDGTLQWTTYVGGRGLDFTEGIATDAEDSIYITGSSIEGTLPRAANRPPSRDQANGFLAKIDSSGGIAWTSYLGGEGGDLANALTVDHEGNILVAGSTWSNGFRGADDAASGGSDVFVAKVSPTGSLLWATRFGGSGDDRGWGIATNSTGDVFVTGSTASADLPGALNASPGGSSDVLLARVSTDGELQWTTRIGGSDSERGASIDCDDLGHVYITSWTLSEDFGALTNPDSADSGAVVTKTTTDGDVLWSTYVTDGQSGWNLARDVICTSGAVLVAGHARDGALIGVVGGSPGSNAYQIGFVSKLDPDGDIQWATYVGRDRWYYTGECSGIVLADSGNAIVTGRTAGVDAFIASLPASTPPEFELAGPATDVSVVRGADVDISWIDADPDDGAQIRLAIDPDDGATPWDNQNHLWIAEGIDEDSDGAGDVFAWDTTNARPGTYTIWGSVDDTTQPVSYSRAAGRVTVEPSPANTPPTLTLDAPAADVAVTQGQPVAIAWTAADPDDNAFIRLAIDPDDNATPWSDDDHTWLAATLSEDTDAGRFVWDTSGLLPGAYTLWAEIYDGTTNAPVYARATGSVTIAPIGTWQSGAVEVAVYDFEGDTDVDPANVRVRFGRNNTVSSITLLGDKPMTGLAITVNGATKVGAIRDERKGDPGDLSFIAVNSPVGKLHLKSGLTGANLNGAQIGSLSLPADADGDGRTDDATGLWINGNLGAMTVLDEIEADVFVGGNVGVLRANSLGDVSVVASGGIRKFITQEWERGSLLAGWVGALKVTGASKLGVLGDAGFDMALTGAGASKRSLGSLSVAHDLSDATWDIAGDVGPITIAGDVTHWTLDVHSSLKRLQAGHIVSANVTVNGAVQALVAAAWDNGRLAADRVGKVRIVGERAELVDGVQEPGFGAELVVGDGGVGSILVKYADFHGVESNGSIGNITVVGGDIFGRIISHDGRIGNITVKGTKWFSTHPPEFGGGGEGGVIGGNIHCTQIHANDVRGRSIGNITLVAGSLGTDVATEVRATGRIGNIVVKKLRYKDALVGEEVTDRWGDTVYDKYGDPVLRWSSRYAHQGGGIWVDLDTPGRLGKLTAVGADVMGAIHAGQGMGAVRALSILRHTSGRFAGIPYSTEVEDILRSDLRATLSAEPGERAVAIPAIIVSGGDITGDIHVVGRIGRIATKSIAVWSELDETAEVYGGGLRSTVCATRVGKVQLGPGTFDGVIDATSTIGNVTSYGGRMYGTLTARDAIGKVTVRVLAIPAGSIAKWWDGGWEWIPDNAMVFHDHDATIEINLGGTDGDVNPKATLGRILGIGADVYVSGSVPFSPAAARIESKSIRFVDTIREDWFTGDVTRTWLTLGGHVSNELSQLTP